MPRSVARFLTLLIAASLVPTALANDGRPNVLIVYADDQGSVDLGCFPEELRGQDDLETPHLDRLAAGGLTLTQMYAPAPVCSASRVGLLTGRYPARAGQPGNGPLAAEETTLAEVFRDAGYRTGLVGKWHLGSDGDRNPAGQGFGDSFGHLGGCIDNYSHFFYWNGPNRHDLFDNGREVYRPGEYFPRLMVDRCKAFVGEGGDAVVDEKPWLLYWAFNAPHYPYQGEPEWLERYADLPTPRREYCAFVSSMDRYIGELLDHLEATDQAENTIVVFQADHGHSTETRAFGGGGNAGPYRGAKYSLFEGGIRVPAVVRYPQRFPAGERREQFLTGCDWLPTLCDLCDVPPPAVTLDGRSIADVLADDAPLDRPPYYWQMGGGAKPQWAVREGRWKLLARPLDTTQPQTERPNGGRLPGEYFLADLNADPGERTNLAAEHPEIVERLRGVRAEIVAGFDDGAE
ncbi:sulfatase family protein [Alienimonas chondri]|uniref:Arylsulfatase n=1 Tax=Alienimonas chondri TaxID=2681879 RepID=A0ABX1VEC9_9PLAN|nr:sulfatase-like hydrolase/transferase [Alienimonas chondri]NNJ26089.1 Arylsulfatase [Alienimonas chondri]